MRAMMQLVSGRKIAKPAPHSSLAARIFHDLPYLFARQWRRARRRPHDEEPSVMDELDRQVGGLDIELHTRRDAGTVPDPLRNDQPAGTIDGNFHATNFTIAVGFHAAPRLVL